jgi:hypothetical protein
MDDVVAVWLSNPAIRSIGLENLFLRVCINHPTVSSPDAYPSFECEKRIAHAIFHSSWLLDSPTGTRRN